MKHEDEANVDTTETETYRAQFETGEADLLVIAIADGIEAITGRDTMGISPLQESINVDALCALFPAERGETVETNGQVTFTHCGCEVTVSTDGTVAVTPTE